MLRPCPRTHTNKWPYYEIIMREKTARAVELNTMNKKLSSSKVSLSKTFLEKRDMAVGIIEYLYTLVVYKRFRQQAKSEETNEAISLTDCLDDDRKQ